MISILYGQVGAGKTYTSIKDFIIPALKQDRHIYTNVDFGTPKFYPLSDYSKVIEYKFSLYLKKTISGKIHLVNETDLLYLLSLPAKMAEASRIPAGSLVVVDEAQDIFYYLDVNKVSRQIYTFLSWSRHLGVDLLFLTQSPQLLNSQIKNLARGNYIEVKNMSQFSLKKMYRLRWYSYENIGEQEPLKQKFGTYDTEIFKLYQSFQLEGASLPPNILKAKFIAIAILLLFFLVFFHRVKTIFHM
jgi:zona occludens toxin (predicted ATPase)